MPYSNPPMQTMIDVQQQRADRSGKTTMTSVTAMISSTLCRPMPFMSR